MSVDCIPQSTAARLVPASQKQEERPNLPQEAQERTQRYAGRGAGSGALVSEYGKINAGGVFANRGK